MQRLPGGFTLRESTTSRKRPLRRIADEAKESIPSKSNLSNRTATYEDDKKRRYYRVDEKEQPEWAKTTMRVYPGCDFMWVSIPKDLTIRDMPMINEKVNLTSGGNRTIRDAFVGKHMKNRKTGWAILTGS
jgi:hypothetical protein